jgi:hypothetical protein
MVLQKTAIPMYEQFTELTNQIFWEGYAEASAKDNHARFQLELSEFMNTCNFKTMEDKIFLLVKVTIRTTHSSIHDAIHELQTQTVLQVSSTPNVEVLQTKIFELNTKK